MTKRGVIVSINSDDAEEATHLNQEAAKTIKFGGLSRDEALKLVTINPAIQLGHRQARRLNRYGQRRRSRHLQSRSAQRVCRCAEDARRWPRPISIAGKDIADRASLEKEKKDLIEKEKKEQKRREKAGCESLVTRSRTKRPSRKAMRPCPEVRCEAQPPLTDRLTAAAVAPFSWPAHRPWRNKSQPTTIAITHAKIFTLAGSPIEDGVLVIKDGKIAAVGAQR